MHIKKGIKMTQSAETRRTLHTHTHTHTHTQIVYC